MADSRFKEAATNQDSQSEHAKKGEDAFGIKDEAALEFSRTQQKFNKQAVAGDPI